LKKLSLRAAEADEGERLDRFIAARGGISRGEARRALDRGGVFLSGKRCKQASRAVRAGERVLVHLEEAGRAPMPAVALDRSRLLYADEELAAFDKPTGVPSQPTLTSDRGHLPKLAAQLLGGPVLPVHRLDRETSGVVVLARTRQAAAALSRAFREGEAAKRYLCLCARAPEPPEGRIDLPLGPDPRRPGRRTVLPAGEPAITGWRTLALGPGGEAAVEARPETGRTHQIRVHLAHLHAPLLGDARYGGPRRLLELSVPRVMLHALRLTLRHPRTGAALSFEAPVPEDLLTVARALGIAL